MVSHWTAMVTEASTLDYTGSTLWQSALLSKTLSPRTRRYL